MADTETVDLERAQSVVFRATSVQEEIDNHKLTLLTLSQRGGMLTDAAAALAEAPADAQLYLSAGGTFFLRPASALAQHVAAEIEEVEATAEDTQQRILLAQQELARLLPP
jgi:chaperonin cofactor prefoldin